MDRPQRIRRFVRHEAAATVNGLTTEHGMPKTGRREKIK
jgi:hypothetical protein